MVDRIRRKLLDPSFWMWFHALQAVKWVLLFVPGMWLWRESVPFLMYVSLDTAMAGALAGFGTALASRKADPTPTTPCSEEISMTVPSGAPTQTRHPWRATARTVAAALVGAATLIPVVAVTAGVDTVPAVAQVVAVAAAVTRVLALPAVDGWLRTYVPWLSAAPPTGR